VGVFVGTSGWSYASWRDGFFQGIPRRAWLSHAAEQFSGLEINATYYRLQSPENFREWSQQAPNDFCFTMKGSRFVTQNKRFRDAERSVCMLRDRARPMGKKLRAVVWQAPTTLRADLPTLGQFIRALRRWRSVAHAIEFRHRSWFTDAVARQLDEAGIGICQSDAADWPCWDAVAGPLVYCRLHGHTRTYASGYSSRSLDGWAARARRWLDDGREVHVYFDNDKEGAAPYDALKLLERFA
jgi:uncharacterized protein YecE (DUF72 family)